MPKPTLHAVPPASSTDDTLHAVIGDLGQLAAVIDLAHRGLTASKAPSDSTFEAAHLLRLTSNRICDVCEDLSKLRERLSPGGAS